MRTLDFARDDKNPTSLLLHCHAESRFIGIDFNEDLLALFSLLALTEILRFTQDDKRHVYFY